MTRASLFLWLGIEQFTDFSQRSISGSAKNLIACAHPLGYIIHMNVLYISYGPWPMICLSHVALSRRMYITLSRTLFCGIGSIS